MGSVLDSREESGMRGEDVIVVLDDEGPNEELKRGTSDAANEVVFVSEDEAGRSNVSRHGPLRRKRTRTTQDEVVLDGARPRLREGPGSGISLAPEEEELQVVDEHVVSYNVRRDDSEVQVVSVVRGKDRDSPPDPSQASWPQTSVAHSGRENVTDLDWMTPSDLGAVTPVDEVVVASEPTLLPQPTSRQGSEEEYRRATRERINRLAAAVGRGNPAAGLGHSGRPDRSTDGTRSTNASSRQRRAGSSRWRRIEQNLQRLSEDATPSWLASDLWEAPWGSLPVWAPPAHPEDDYEANLRLDETVASRVGASRDVIRSIKSTPVTAEDVNEICAICLVKFERRKKLKRLPCEHAYHPKCIDQWLKINASCPMCKRRYTGPS